MVLPRFADRPPLTSLFLSKVCLFLDLRSGHLMVVELGSGSWLLNSDVPPVLYVEDLSRALARAHFTLVLFVFRIAHPPLYARSLLATGSLVCKARGPLFRILFKFQCGNRCVCVTRQAGGRARPPARPLVGPYLPSPAMSYDDPVPDRVSRCLVSCARLCPFVHLAIWSRRCVCVCVVRVLCCFAPGSIPIAVGRWTREFDKRLFGDSRTPLAELHSLCSFAKPPSPVRLFERGRVARVPFAPSPHIPPTTLLPPGAPLANSSSRPSASGGISRR
ncbi:hypothetical protein BKA62DRAFT_303274 [Auriculariales sp. MPI-PUGE-AT-0066]|nr:hypothetical protein BKA62DRAFT_303274 [Auriculariales sp. MPI-PUGE-AT-0066]